MMKALLTSHEQHNDFLRLQIADFKNNANLINFLFLFTSLHSITPLPRSF